MISSNIPLENKISRFTTWKEP